MSIFNLSTEDISNYDNLSGQKSKLFIELTGFYAWVKEQIRKSEFRKPEVKKVIKDIIFKHTGINVKVSTSNTFACIFPDINKNSVLNNKFIKKYLSNNDFKKLDKQYNVIEGFVDTKNFKVSGIFSELEADLYLDTEMVYSEIDIPASDLAAITIHEIGHLFSFYSMLGNEYNANIPMLATLNKITNCKNAEQITMVLRECNLYNTTTTNKIDVEELSKKKKEVIIMVLVSDFIINNKSISNSSDIYNNINAEYIADKFVARHGAGPFLARSIEYFNREPKVRLNNFGLATILTSIYSLAYIGFTSTFSLTVPLVLLPITYLFIRRNDTNSNDFTYDKTYERIRRIRDDLVLQLKVKDIDNALAENIRDQIKSIDNILSTVKNTKSLFASFMDFVFHIRHKMVTQTEFYSELESFANNNLFLAAYDLKRLV